MEESRGGRGAVVAWPSLRGVKVVRRGLFARLPSLVNIDVWMPRASKEVVDEFVGKDDDDAKRVNWIRDELLDELQAIRGRKLTGLMYI